MSNDNLPAEKDASQVQIAKIGDDWVIEAPETGPIIIRNASLARAIVEIARFSYYRGRRDLSRQLRELIGAVP